MATQITSIVSSGVFKGYLNYIATFKSVVLQRSSSVVSVFTSIGGFVAFFADFIDKKWDSRLQIKY